MACLRFQGKLSGYVDDGLSPRDTEAVRQHLEFCQDCRKELARYRRLKQLLGRLECVPVPPEVSQSLRVELSRAASRDWWASLRVQFENMLKPLMLPATAGIVTAVFCFGLLLSHLPVGMPSVVASDVPLNLVTPPRPVNVGTLEWNNGDESVVVEALVDSSGRVVDYRILSGPHTRAVTRRLDRTLIFTQFYPAMSFGTPIGGRVVLSFRRIQVKG